MGLATHTKGTWAEAVLRAARQSGRSRDEQLGDSQPRRRSGTPERLRDAEKTAPAAVAVLRAAIGLCGGAFGMSSFTDGRTSRVDPEWRGSSLKETSFYSFFFFPSPHVLPHTMRFREVLYPAAGVSEELSILCFIFSFFF